MESRMFEKDKLKKEEEHSFRLFTFRVITFAWAGFIMGVIIGALIFNYLELKDFGAPLFAAIVFSVVGGLFGIKLERRFPSKSSSTCGKIVNIIFFLAMVAIALITLAFGLIANNDFSGLFS